ncbi:MAG: hypothetical protein CMP12_19100 [Zunongwangia sp.]|nr:polysaccharide biosynthesis C-terminal domain-containing protein [Zunongwangia profunda]MAB91628.1 hypothetical protein [Planctomycetota bacterium]MAO37977.1 hypothetical protein [Zunongwangia sp.]MAS72474.1 hypothetical protein [Zunongwangia sp.]
MIKLKNKLVSDSFWGILAKIIDAGAKFFTIPMLVGYYGKSDYGLIALVFSLNAYMRLMDMGINIGSIRFFSLWIKESDYQQISEVSRSSVTFYGVLGVINAIVFFILANFGVELFGINESQVDVFKSIMYILAITTIFEWASNVVNQLLIANDKIGWVSRVKIFSNVCMLISALLAINYFFSLELYFFFYTISMLIIIPLNIYKLNSYQLPLLSLILPGWNWYPFRKILKYSLAIFAMGIFQMTANNLRPLLLGRFSRDGVEVLTDYRVIQTIAMLVIAIGGVFMQVLLPSTSKHYADGNQRKLDEIVYDGTKYITLLLSLIVFILCLNAKLILYIYMGEGYDDLALWLIIWLITVLLSMHNAPVASLVLATGKTKFLVYSSAIACVASIPITIILAYNYNVGAAVIGYAVYMIFQIGFYYFYYTNKVLKFNSRRLFFQSFFPPALIGTGSWVLTAFVFSIIKLDNIYFELLLRSVLFVILFLVFSFKLIIKPKDLKSLIRKQ